MFIPAPNNEDNKYTRGVVRFATGSSSYQGAAVLGVAAALNTGVGYVEFASNDKKLSDYVLHFHPEVVVKGSDYSSPKAKTYVYGSGWDKYYFDAIHSICDDEIVILDASAMQYLCRFVFLEDTITDEVHAKNARLNDNIIITPHLGELVNLLNLLYLRFCQIGEYDDSLRVTPTLVKQNPEKYAKMLHDLTGVTVLLKGSINIIVNSSGTELVESNAYNLATAGTGDVLAGIIGGVFAIMSANIINMDRGESVGKSSLPTFSALQIREILEMCVHIQSDSATFTAKKKGHRLAPVLALEVAQNVSKVIWKYF